VAEGTRSVWLITVGEPLPFGGSKARLWRTGILANTLAGRGHRVTWWTSSVDHFSKTFFVESALEHRTDLGVTLQFLHGCMYAKNISFSRLRNHRQIAAQFRELAERRAPPDVVVCSYPTIELSAEAASYGMRHSIPVLLDIRDLWPDELAARLPKALGPLAAMLLRGMYRQAEYALRHATGLTAISDRYLEWGLRHARRDRGPDDAVFTHGYPAPATSAPSRDALDKFSKLGIDPSKKIFWFVGTFVGSIDLATVIEAAALLRDRPDVQFVFAGSGERDLEWRERARGLPNIVFTGWCSADEIAALASIAWAGLGAYKRGALMSLTNKIFEYMAYGLPILLSLGGEAREIVEQTGCGLHYEAGSAEALALAVRRLSAGDGLRDQMAVAARVSFAERYDAAAVYDRMAAHIERVAEHERSARTSTRPSWL
jgi:glycosyltransferase involved in cell wall biosynthesis